MSNLSDRLKKFMEEKNISANAVSRSLGLSSATLSQYLSGQYKGAVKKVDAAVEDFLQLENERSAMNPGELPFMPISSSKRVFDIAKMTHLCGDIGIAYGDAGLGKTRAVKQYSKDHTDVILIEADLGFTARILFQELCRSVGVDPEKNSLHAMFEEIVKKLNKSGRLIIIDEAEHLPYKALEMLRRVHDKAGIGILLVGMPRLLFNLRGKKGEFTQLYSRVGVASKLEPLKESDTEMIVKKILPDSNGCYKTFHSESLGNARRLSKLIARSIMVADLNGVPLSHQVIKETASMLII